MLLRGREKFKIKGFPNKECCCTMMHLHTKIKKNLDNCALDVFFSKCLALLRRTSFLLYCLYFSHKYTYYKLQSFPHVGPLWAAFSIYYNGAQRHLPAFPPTIEFLMKLSQSLLISSIACLDVIMDSHSPFF